MRRLRAGMNEALQLEVRSLQLRLWHILTSQTSHLLRDSTSWLHASPRSMAQQRLWYFQDRYLALCRRIRCVVSLYRHWERADLALLGWVVLGKHTKIEDPGLNFRDAFAGSSHSGNDVRSLVTHT